MSFLKKHWRFTVPAVVVLSTLLIGVVVLYSTGEPPEPKTVYAMPERGSPDNRLPINIGGISTATLIELKSNTGTNAENEMLESPPYDSANDTESFEACCDDEPIISEQDAAVLSKQLVGGMTSSEWESAVYSLHDKERARSDAYNARRRKRDALVSTLVASLTSDQRERIRADAEAKMSREDLQYSAQFWESLPPPASEQSIEQLATALEALEAFYSSRATWDKERDKERQELDAEARKLGL